MSSEQNLYLPSKLAQKAELIALNKALELGGSKKINIYTNRTYAFTTVHIHGTIYQESRLLTSEEKEIKSNRKSWIS